MTRLDNLQDVANRQLGGLNADAALKGRIRAAARGGAAKRRALRWQPAAALALCALVCVFAGVSALAPGGILQSVGGPKPTEIIDSLPAGDNIVLPKDDENLRALLDLTGGSLKVGAQQEAPAYRSLYAKGSGGNFPLVMIDGKTYRMLKSPSKVSSKQKGDELGQVTEYTEEPALSSGDGVVSNTVALGETVYAARGMSGALALATLDGKLRVFQRVSFSGTAVVGSETLGDVLCGSGDVDTLELSGVGTLEGEDAQRLMQVLLDNAEYSDASADFSAKQSLVIGLNSGLSMQLMVKNDAVSACGTWSCPEFFEAFAAAMGQ